MGNSKIADKDEVLEYLTGIMRDGDSEKDRLLASKQLGKYLGLEVGRVQKVELSADAKVTIYDDVSDS